MVAGLFGGNPLALAMLSLTTLLAVAHAADGLLEDSPRQLPISPDSSSTVSEPGRSVKRTHIRLAGVTTTSTATAPSRPPTDIAAAHLEGITANHSAPRWATSP